VRRFGTDDWFTTPDQPYDEWGCPGVAGPRGGGFALRTEKALKAVLVEHAVEFPKTHDVEQLVEIIEEQGLVFPADLDKVLEFTPFATQGRYPGFDDAITEADVQEALGLAEKVLAWARQEVARASGAGS